jgi:primosomal protein N' (replication factor Y)
VIVGTRSAVFAPAPALGLIVVVRESDPSYKAEESPPYHAREVAAARGAIEKIPVLFTAIAPSVETYARFRKSGGPILGEGFREGLQRTAVTMVDLKTQKFGESLSAPLRDAIGRHLSAGQAVLLLLNRKGFSTALLCRDCGHLFRCGRCSVTLAFHRRLHQLTCRYCGMTQKLPTVCPRCKGTRLDGIGVGIEQAEASLRQAFPDVRVQRVQREGPSSPASRTAGIWLATNWIFRRPDRPRFSLVGLVDADGDFYHPDFRASERAFQSIVQALAEAQRGPGRPGREVVIQTRYPEHPAIAWVRAGDPEVFYRAELSEREALGYPPFMALAAITLRSAGLMLAETTAKKWGDRLREEAGDRAGIQILGPVPAPLAFLRGRHRFLLLVKASTHELLAELIRAAQGSLRSRGSSRVRVGIDVDPISIL